MRDNPLQFAVVREDPRLEAELITGQRVEDGAVLLVASGGCTALSLARWFPALSLTLCDVNPAQLAHVEQKRVALAQPQVDLRLFNVDDARADGLNARGNFESLFRGLAHFLHEFVAPYAAWRDAFTSPSALARFASDVTAHRYWPVAFELYFAAPLLVAMFGPDAVQHAAPDSYPGYFRGVFERGLRAPEAATNYFLHHVFLGHYLGDAPCLPPYLPRPGAAAAATPPREFEAQLGPVEQVRDAERFAIVSLSNICDWMPASKSASLGRWLGAALRPGALVLLRQLNNLSDMRPAFPRFTLEGALSERLTLLDRSLFYGRVLVFRKTAASG